MAVMREDGPAAKTIGVDATANGRGSRGGTTKGSEESWTVRNLTAGPLELHGRDDGVLVLPAYGCRIVEHEPRSTFDCLKRAEGAGQVEVTRQTQPAPVDYTLLSLWVFLVPGMILLGYWLGTWGWIAGAVLVLLPLCVVALNSDSGKARLRAFLGELPALSLQVLTFLVVLTFCLLVPAVTLYYGANVKAVVGDITDGNATTVDYLTLVCRTMQLVLISVASLLPALMFYQFDRDRMSTLREKFEQQIFRLDRTMKTSLDIDAKYGRQIDEIYGRERPGRSSRLQPGRRTPIFVATVLIMLGWLLVLLNPDVGLVDNEDTIAELFEPRQTAPAFAFLGAYFFALFALLRGYVRRDLRPKSYSDISVRIVAVVILAWVLDLVFVNDSAGLLVFAFIVGIVPQAALNKLREVSQGGWSGLRREVSGPAEGLDDQEGPDSTEDGDVAAALADPLPLTNLQGIDLYDRTRLASEGVTNIEALAHHDLVELMLLTRIPVPRLVDWTDQAILHLHVDPGDRLKLKRYGIRTASDLVHAYTSATNRDEFLAILGGEDGKPKRLELIVEAMKDEAWMANIRFWHGDVDAPESGNGKAPDVADVTVLK